MPFFRILQSRNFGIGAWWVLRESAHQFEKIEQNSRERIEGLRDSSSSSKFQFGAWIFLNFLWNFERWKEKSGTVIQVIVVAIPQAFWTTLKFKDWVRELRACLILLRPPSSTCELKSPSTSSEISCSCFLKGRRRLAAQWSYRCRCKSSRSWSALKFEEESGS